MDGQKAGIVTTELTFKTREEAEAAVAQMGGQAVAEISLEAVVIRCGCGDPDSHFGATCPTPREREDLGVVAFTSKDPLRMLQWRLGRLKRLAGRWKRRVWG